MLMKTGSSKYACLLLILVFLLGCGFSADAQKKNRRRSDKDSLLTLLNAEYARVFERPGKREYREVKGPATFLHNGAYMFCDSAIWNVSFNQVEAYENVKLVQNKTVITSDNVIYYADDNVARFRGDVVEVHDKDKNTLRTKYLDYNTEDSTAKFTFGGAMRTSKGEVIESDRGTYDAKTGICRFEDNVEMFTDSLFIKTNSLDYDTNEEKAYFGKKTQMWKNDVYMRGEYGWYQQDSGVVYFDTEVYLNNPDYEGWCDTLYYFQHRRNGRMRRNVQLLDSLNSTYFVSDAGNVSYDSVNNLYATLFLDPASVVVGENSEKKTDTLFLRADTLLFYTQRVCDITEEQLKDSEAARSQVNFDAIGEAERKAQEKKEQEIKAAIEKLPEYKAYQKRKELAGKRFQDSVAAARAQAEKDSLAALAQDTLNSAAALPDTLQADQAPDDNLSAQDGPENALPEASSVSGVLSSPEREPAKQQDQPAAGPPEGRPSPGRGRFQKRGNMEPDASGGGSGEIGAPLRSDNVQMPENPDIPPIRDSLTAPLDSLASADSLKAATVENRDTTQLRFVKGYRNARIYRTDIQARCDSLYFSQIDTLLRMFLDPVIWNDNRHQLSAEEVVMQMKDDSFDRANLHGNAMIISQEDTLHYDQIKSTEMLGYFNSDNTLRRFDALGGVNAMFFMQEDSVITILNSKQAQFMMVTLKDGVAEKLKYYESVNSDAYPVYDLPVDKQRLKGFKWRIEEQPKSRFDITRRKLRPSKRATYAVNKLPLFRRTNMYYDDYMKDIYHQIEERAEQARLEQARRDSLEAVRQEEQSRMAADTTLGIHTAFDKEGEVIIDSLATLKSDVAPKADTLAGPVVLPGLSGQDSVAAVRRQARLDSLSAVRDAARARLDSLRNAVEQGRALIDSAESAVRSFKPGADSVAAAAFKNIEGIENHSDEGFVEVQLPKDGQNITREEKQALKKAARELRRQQKKLEREARKAEREAKRAAAKAEREARKAAVAAEKAARKAAAAAEREAKKAAAEATRQARKAAAEERAAAKAAERAKAKADREAERAAEEAAREAAKAAGNLAPAETPDPATTDAGQ